jgi:uncharacterized protein YndB with AHSA1/START domain
MEKGNKTTITIECEINVPAEKVWQYWAKPEHITQWNNASDDWYTPHAENDLREGGRFVQEWKQKMKASDLIFPDHTMKLFYLNLLPMQIDDSSKVSITFKSTGNTKKIIETFEAENEHSIEVQRSGWQSILNNFRKYTEAH